VKTDMVGPRFPLSGLPGDPSGSEHSHFLRRAPTGFIGNFAGKKLECEERGVNVESRDQESATFRQKPEARSDEPPKAD
jgi:hypothetical protein